MPDVLAAARANLARAVSYLKRTDAARRRPQRLPQQVPPFAIEAAYAKDLVALVRRARPALDHLIHECDDLVAAAHAARGDARFDVGESSKRLSALVKQAVQRMSEAIKPEEVRALAIRHGTQAVDHNKAQLGRQLRAGMGVDPTFKDKHLPEQMEQWAHRNAALITRIPPRLGGQVEGIVLQAVASSTPNERVGAQIAAQFDIEERHARLIARDQIGKLVAQVNHSRQRALGITSFIWRTCEDERVRESHAELDGEQYDYDDPPDGDDGPALPGDDICCRCYAEPVIPDEDDEEPDDDDEPDDEGGDDEEPDDEPDDEEEPDDE